jgi:hypothetical protein
LQDPKKEGNGHHTKKGSNYKNLKKKKESVPNKENKLHHPSCIRTNVQTFPSTDPQTHHKYNGDVE